MIVVVHPLFIRHIHCGGVMLGVETGDEVHYVFTGATLCKFTHTLTHARRDICRVMYKSMCMQKHAYDSVLSLR